MLSVSINNNDNEYYYSVYSKVIIILFIGTTMFYIAIRL